MKLTTILAVMLTVPTALAADEWKPAEFGQSPPCELTTLGAPKAVDSPQGRAMRFDGRDDGLILGCNPLDGLTEFTVEVVFYPHADGPTEQRFLHFGHAHGNRVLLETRVTQDGHWYLDSYIQTGAGRKTLIDPKLLHPADQWHHVAYVVKDGHLQNYVNGKRELSAQIAIKSIRGGDTSIGVRLNRVYWFKGAIHSIRISSKALAPEQFADLAR